MSPPLVSVCIPTYNSAHFLRQAIESVLSQAFADFELVVVDDASRDETPSLCARYTDPRFRYRRFEQNAGQSGSFNRCLAEASGELLTILHSDDYFLPGFLADRVEHLRAHPQAGFVFGAYQVVDAEDRPLSTGGAWSEDRDLPSREILESLFSASVICPSSMMIRRSTAERAGPFRTDLTWGQDWDWAIRLAEISGAFFCARPLAAYRVHDASGTAEMLNAARNGEQERRILTEAFRRASMRDRSFAGSRPRYFRALGLRHLYYAEQALLARRNAVARHNILYALRAEPRFVTKPVVWAILASSYTHSAVYTLFKRGRGLTRPQP